MSSNGSTWTITVILLAATCGAAAAPASALRADAPAAPVLADEPGAPAGTYEGRLLAPAPLPVSDPLGVTGPVGGISGASSQRVDFGAPAGGWQFELTATDGEVEACWADETDQTLGCARSDGVEGTLPAGTRSAVVTVVDGVAVDYRLVVRDSVAPALTVSAPTPGALVASLEVSVAYVATDAASGVESVECGLDGAAPTPCASGAVLAVPASGAHTLLVRATDRAGNTGAQVVVFVVDADAPLLSLTTPLDGAAYGGDALDAVFDATDAVSGVADVSCALDGADLAPCSSPHALGALANGPHTFTLRATDVAGHVAQQSVAFLVDGDAPVVSILAPADGALFGTPAIVATFEATDALTAIAVTCSLDGAAHAPCASPHALDGLASGTHSFAVRATDAVGNVAETSVAFVVDVDAPVVTFTSPRDGEVMGPVFSAHFTTSDALSGVASVACSIDGAPDEACASPLPIEGLATGHHALTVRATDAAGNVREATRRFIVDATGPVVTILSPLPGEVLGVDHVSVAFDIVDDWSPITSTSCSSDGIEWVACGVAYDVYGTGPKAAYVTATDAKGNQAATASVEFVLDPYPPSLIVSAPEEGSHVSGTTLSVVFSATDAESGLASVECALDDQPQAPCTSPHEFAGLSPGWHSVSVVAVDRAGYATHVLHTFRVDHEPPMLFVHAPSPGATVDGRKVVVLHETVDDSGMAVALDCSLNGGSYSPCASGSAVAGLVAGANTLVVRATDLAGNLASVSVAFTARTAPDVAVGDWHSCSLDADGVVRCWGADNFGATGTGAARNAPTLLSGAGLTGIVALGSGGGNHTCAIVRADGSVSCWGSNDQGQLGDGTVVSRSAPAPVSGLDDVDALASGASFTCALRAIGTVHCWGYNGYGQLGDGTTSQRRTPVQGSGLADVVAIAASGSHHACAVRAGGTVWCWGFNGFGQLGDGTTTQRLTPVQVAGLPTAVGVATGFSHSCALLAGGAVRCWGANSVGQLGDGTTTQRLIPVPVVGLSDATAISSRNDHTCAIRQAGSVACWGSNVGGRLGDGTLTMRTSPVQVLEVDAAVALAVGSGHSCVLEGATGGLCWGANDAGQLGAGVTFRPFRPLPVYGLSGLSATDAGEHFSCFRGIDAKARCTGDNTFGQLGVGTRVSSHRAMDVVGLTDVASISTGAHHACARLNDSTVRCWGRNANGQLGDGTTTDRLTPVAVPGLTGVASISAGELHTCAHRSNGTVACWGANTQGQLGDGTTTQRNSPVTVPLSPANVLALAAGGHHTCVIRSGSTTWCWGWNADGQVGDGTVNNIRVSPTQVTSNAAGHVGITAGDRHTCAWTSTGIVRCWGWGGFGQLGNGLLTNRATPTNIVSFGVATSVSAGEAHTCAVRNNGAAYCWGMNQHGQLGDGTTAQRSVPVLVLDLSGATAVTAGSTHSCAVLSDGTARCWGASERGQLGEGQGMPLAFVH